MELKFLLFYFKVFLLILLFNDSTQDGPYGLYQVATFTVKVCEKTMKPMGSVLVNYDVRKNANGHHIVRSMLNVTKEIGPLMGKTRIYKWSDGKYSKTLTMNQANVCQYAFPLKALPYTFKIDKNCIAQVADYPETTIDVDGLAQGLLGKKFFYGRFKFIFEWFTKKLTAICAESVAELAPLGVNKNIST